MDSILYKYKEDEWSNKCYEEKNVDGGSAYEDITIQCMHTVPAAKLTICVADSDKNNPLTETDIAQAKRYDYLVVNEDFKRAHTELLSIVQSARLRQERQSKRAAVAKLLG